LPSLVLGRSYIQEWYKELGPEKLSSVRVFLGWTSEAQVVLGTQNSFAPTVDVSGAFDCEAGRNVKIYGGSTGLGMSGIASLSVNISGTRSAAASGISGIESKENKDVVLILANGVKNHLVIDNNDDETGWLIAQTTVFLFLVQIFLLRQPSPLAVLPPECLSKPAVDSGQTALKYSQISKKSLRRARMEPCHICFLCPTGFDKSIPTQEKRAMSLQISYLV
jgi:hypothetical protein